MKLKIKNEWVPNLQREGDAMLMDYFISLKYKPKDLHDLNLCRIYMQALSLADITSADGKTIIPDCKLGRRLIDRRSSLSWPTQQRPSNSAWSLWTDALRHLEAGSILKQPLQQWIAPSHQHWFWFIEQDSLRIYHTEQHRTWSYIDPTVELTQPRTRQANRRCYQYELTPSTDTVDPSKLLPITRNKSSNNTHWHATPGPPLYTPNTQEPVYGWRNRLCREAFYARLLGPLGEDIDQVIEQIREEIHTNELYICTDGSYCPQTQTGAHGWVIATKEGLLWKGAGPVDCHQTYMSPYRAELGGILAGLYILHSLSEDFPNSGGTITLWCD